MARKPKKNAKQPRRRKLSDKEMVEEFLHRSSLLERCEPVLVEWVGVLSRCQQPTGRQKALPAYCYNIFEVLNKTVCRIVPTVAETFVREKGLMAFTPSGIEPEPLIKIDWQRLGRISGVAMRCLGFWQKDAEGILKSEGLLDLDAKEEGKIFEVVVGKRWLRHKLEELALKEPGRPVEEIAEKLSTALNERITRAVADLERFVGEPCSEEMAKFYDGMAEGLRGFVDGDGQFAGQSTRFHVYLFLLIAWREVKEMQDSHLGKTRKDLVELMKPFGALGIVNPLSEDQLADVCDEIGLRIKGRGRPKKSG
jgi:hypothetical protein